MLAVVSKRDKKLNYAHFCMTGLRRYNSGLELPKAHRIVMHESRFTSNDHFREMYSTTRWPSRGIFASSPAKWTPYCRSNAGCGANRLKASTLLVAEIPFLPL
eukprot:1130286-Pleurochrysis_carterae.AAC.1